jgi:hypothetical protein
MYRSADVLLCFAIFPQHRFCFVRNTHKTKAHSELPRLLALVGALPALFSSAPLFRLVCSGPVFFLLFRGLALIIRRNVHQHPAFSDRDEIN